MKIISKEELGDILANHKKWLDSDGKEGERANLRDANLRHADLSNANLIDADLIGANLYNTNLSNANLSHADLSDANLSNINLRYANLYNTNLTNVTLINADLSNANLENVDLSEADLSYANLEGIVGKEISTFKYNKHIAYCVDGYIGIGCEYHTIAYWLEHYQEIGKEAKYSEEEIEKYGSWIKDMASIKMEYGKWQVIENNEREKIQAALGGQSKKLSGLEACLNTFSGMVIAFSISQLACILTPTIQKYISKDFVWDINYKSNIVITIILTIVSVGRSYVWRRYFNKLLIRK